MTPERKAELVTKMKDLQGYQDTEGAHGSADGLLLTALDELGFHELVVEWLEVDKWYA